MSEKETATASASIAIAEVLFAVNWRADVAVNMRIVYKGLNYNIVRVDDFEGHKTDLKLYATLVLSA